MQDASSAGDKFRNLVDIMAKLRGPNGCPWDHQQTHESLRPYLIEEAYEVLEALDEKDYNSFKEELGDLLLQVIFHAQIAAEDQRFQVEDVIEAISEKLIRRHPNVFGDVQINSAEEQAVNWEKLKKKEGKESVVDGVPKALPALSRAWRIQQKASTVGFDWPEVEPVWEKIHEEIEELKSECRKERTERIEEEFGDLLFSLVNLSRFIKVNPEDSLHRATHKFITRFRKVEQTFAAEERDMSDADLQELDEVWERVKSEEA